MNLPNRMQWLYARKLTVACAVYLTAPSVYALPIDIRNDDISVRWDNTLKYSLGMRTKNPSGTLTEDTPAPADGAAGPSALNADDGDRSFKRGDLISNRVDILSELDVVSQQGYGFRVSGAAWYDDVYHQSNDNDSSTTANSTSTSSSHFTSDTRKLHGGTGELLDAFMFGGIDIGETRLTGRLGRHTVLWGESLYFSSNSIAGLQSPVDSVKASSVPGSTTKELVRPVGQLSGQWQLTPDVSLIGYYQYEWERTRLPGAGSYFSTSDVLDEGGERIRASAGEPGDGYARGHDQTAKDNGQFGIGLKTRFDNVDVGVYALRYHAKTPAVYLHPGMASSDPLARLGLYELVYPEDIKAFGISATTTVGQINYAAEVSIRRDTPLTSNSQVILPGGIADNDKHPYYAVGNSAHAQLSALWTMSRNFLSDEPSLNAEVAWNRMTSCDKNCTPSTASNFRPNGALDPNANRDAYAFRFTFAIPQRSVLDGLDLTPSVTASYAHGKSSVAQLGPDRGGDMTLSLAANYLAVWDLTAAYTHYYGAEMTSSYSSTQRSLNGTSSYQQALKDRDFVSLSLKRTF